MIAKLLTLFSLASPFCLAQTTAPFDSLHWEMAGKVSPETYQSKAGILLTDGFLYLKDNTFVDGVIEFDMTLSKNRYFPGVGFRLQDKENYEHIYLRPHQLGNPDAIQYTPVFNAQSAWQLYYGDGYSTALTYPLNEWVHIKLAVRGTQAEVYVGNPAKPALVIQRLKRGVKAGRISLENEASAPTRFANFQYTKTDNPTLQGPFKPEGSPRPGTIMHWQISNTFDEKKLENAVSLPSGLVSQMTWQTLAAEPTGVVNVSSISKLSETSNTVFAKLIIQSDQDQVKRFQFGFSDRAKVYCNDRLLYAGHDEFMSRDYRFLGTIGYFDAIYLNLKKGKNELWLAISENFGGWGLQGIIADQSGLTLTP
ncbi:hypothetical protein WBJ53_20065 [Spirosoma sp. SC4-14]|uniref:hypothetical protein n=1 Tax=Spirosoma sp. SC4-14 TaxID=3128900 RepID=UPI0030CF8298